MQRTNVFARKSASRGLSSVCCVILAGIVSGCGGTVIVNAEKLCQDWRHKTVSKDDKMTNDTAADIRADNLSRPAWGCAYGQNKAKG